MQKLLVRENAFLLVHLLLDKSNLIEITEDELICAYQVYISHMFSKCNKKCFLFQLSCKFSSNPAYFPQIYL